MVNQMRRHDKKSQAHQYLPVALLPTLQHFHGRRHQQQADHGLQANEGAKGHDHPRDRAHCDD